MAKVVLYLALLASWNYFSVGQDQPAAWDDYDGQIHIHPEDQLTEDEIVQLSTLLDGRMGSSLKLRAQSYLNDQSLSGMLGEEPASLCPNHTNLILEGLVNNEMWALHMLDATGRQPSALLYDANIRWLGSWEECLGVEPVAYEDPVNKTGPYTPFEPRYCDARFTFSQPPMPKAITVTIGMCFPSSCDTTEMKKIAEAYAQFIQPGQGSPLKIRSVTCKETDLELTDKAIATIVLCSLIGAAMLAATVYDLLLTFYFVRPMSPKAGITNPLYQSTKIDDVEKAKIASNSDSGEGTSPLGTEEKTPLLGDRVSHATIHTNRLSPDGPVKTVLEIKDQTNDRAVEPGILGRLLLSFSAYTNGSKILDTSQAAGTLTAVNGIRFLSMSWVILGHTLTGTSIDNYNTYIAKLIKRWPFQAIANATVSVDTFFVLSGLLVAYLTLKDMKKRGGPRRVNWLIYYFHRYWRLTPPYMLVLMVYVTCLKYWGDGPLWSPWGMHKDECEKSWWHNMLYINNLVDHKETPQCMGWGWYLANDMQFYWLSPLMLIPLYYSKILGSLVCFAFILTNLISAGVISRDNDIYASPKIDIVRGNSEKIYVKPYTRIAPYVIGILVGYILYRTNCKVRMNKLLALLGWAVAATLALLVVYGPYTPDGLEGMTADERAFYNAAHRTAWGLAVGWVVFACATGYGGPVNVLLSWRAFVPLSRLTYCAYLVHPVVLRIYSTTARALQHWYDLQFAYVFLGNLCCSMAVAFVTSLAFESPMMGLEKVLLARYKK